MGSYAEVIVDVQSRAVDRPFHYYVPPQLYGSLQPGHRVIVPFGSLTVVGYVIRIVDESPIDEVKPILRILDEEPLFNQRNDRSGPWLSEETYMANRCLAPHLATGHTYQSEKHLVYALHNEALETAHRIEARAPKQGISFGI